MPSHSRSVSAFRKLREALLFAILDPSKTNFRKQTEKSPREKVPTSL